MLLFAFLLAYQELNADLKFDIRQVEFFMKGNLCTDIDMMDPADMKLGDDI